MIPFPSSIFMKLGAHGPNRPTSAPRAQIMRKSIFTAVWGISDAIFTDEIGPLLR